MNTTTRYSLNRQRETLCSQARDEKKTIRAKFENMIDAERLGLRHDLLSENIRFNQQLCLFKPEKEELRARRHRLLHASNIDYDSPELITVNEKLDALMEKIDAEKAYHYDQIRQIDLRHTNNIAKIRLEREKSISLVNGLLESRLQEIDIQMNELLLNTKDEKHGELQ